jgi:thiol-disulfide isomerase/thioredoxin
MRLFAMSLFCLLSLLAVAFGQVEPPASPAADYPPESGPSPYPLPHEPGMPPRPPTAPPAPEDSPPAQLPPPAYAPPACPPWSAAEWHYQEAVAPQPSQGVRWRSDLESAKREAAETGRLVLLHFVATWCRPCRELEDTVLSQPQVMQAIEQHLVPLKLDLEKSRPIAQQYQVTSIPTYVVITPAGKVIGRGTGKSEMAKYLERLNDIAASAGRIATAPQAERVPPPKPRASPTRFDHLMQAAQHLEAAGLKEQAAEVRRKAKQEELRPLLAEKLQQLAALKAEIRRLREAAGPDQQVKLEVQLLEVPAGELPRLTRSMARSGLVRFSHRRSQSAEKQACTVGLMSAKADREALLKLLSGEKDLRVIACPTLVTTSGRTATFSSGGEFPVVVRGEDGDRIHYKKFGMELEFVPHVLDNGHVRLAVRPRVSRVDHARSTKIGDHVVPGLCVRECDLGIEVRSGETLVLCWPGAGDNGQPVQQTSGDAASEEGRDVLLLVTPKLIEGDDDQACARAPR